ncbi:MAG TPA: hypothetical protein VGF45_02490, partial [Polyangia bacterium]
MRGKTDEAEKQLVALLEGGDTGVAAPLAEIAAFKDKWAEVVRHALTFMRDPSSAGVGNVLADMINLVAVAGFKSGAWSDIHGEVVAVRKHLLSKKDLKQYADEDAGGGGFQQLIDLAKAKGKADYVWDWSYYSEDDEATRDKQAEATIADQLAKHAKKKLFKDEGERRRRLFALAKSTVSYKTAVRLYDEEGIDDLRTFDSVIFVAAALA